MALAPRIELRQSQSLVMTPQLQQAIKLLRMSNLELAGYLATEVEKNPLLELAPPAAASGSAAPAAGGTIRRGDGDGSYLDTLAAETSLYEHLRAQIGAMRAPPERAQAALLLADELEEDGYLRAPLDEVAARHGLRPALASAGLAMVQACDPAGVGARSLRECLALQLRERDRLDPAMQAMLENLGARRQRPAGRARGALRRRCRGRGRHAGRAPGAGPEARAALRCGPGAGGGAGRARAAGAGRRAGRWS